MILTPTNVGLAIKKVRKSKSLTQQDFANRVGITRNYLALLERGCREASLSCLGKIARISGISLGDLIVMAVQCTKEDSVIIRSKLAGLQQEVERQV